MFDFLRNHQVDMMIGLSSICAIIALFTVVTKTMYKRRKRALLLMQISSAIWLEADRFAYLYHGVTDIKGYWIVRISNFLVFLLINVVLLAISLYIDDVLKNEGELTFTPLPLKVAQLFSAIAICLVIISQFTGLYYTFDAQNIYHRSRYYAISYIFPYLVLIIQFMVLIRYRKNLRGKIAASVFMFDIVSLIASFVQLFAYGVSLVDMSAVAMVIGLYIFALIDMNERVEKANEIIINQLKDEQQSMKDLFEQTVTVIATAIDAKDKYTHGHSFRVAEYAKEIALLSGMDEKKCNEVYYSSLVHDIDKIGIKDDILQKDTNLKFSFLSVGAKYHHERYDGNGYPEGLSGEAIPDIARIVAVADKYDELTSSMSFREPLPQSTVREEILKDAGNCLDPKYAEIMVNMIDKDTSYLMRETEDDNQQDDHTDLTRVRAIHFDEYKECVSDGIQITDHITRIFFTVNRDEGYEDKFSMPAIVLFDSFDGCVHKDDRNIRVLNYIEYGEIWPDGKTISTAARNIKTEVTETSTYLPECEIEAVRVKDHVRIKIRSGYKKSDIIVALLDAVRFSYIGITGEHCTLQNIKVEIDDESVPENYIPRIAEEISYINRLEGDIPNVQVNGYRSAITKPLPVYDGMRIRFYNKSLPTANLIWHCAYILLFSADDEKQDGLNYREYACIRIDGENATKVKLTSNDLIVKKDDEFKGWDVWKEKNRKGFECEVSFRRKKNKIIMTTSNAGISIKCTTMIPPGNSNVLVSLTGDQCTLTNISVF